ncbi:MAG: hypothetical protein HY720_13325, partial [Planctomycetes bacterium]|nr:hypothetical protein [Planctomycetota bacterium]
MNGTATLDERRAGSRHDRGAEHRGDWLESSRLVFHEFHRQEHEAEKARRARLAELGVRRSDSKSSSASLALRRAEGAQKIRRSFRLALVRAGFGAGLALSIAGLVAAVLHVESAAPASGAPDAGPGLAVASAPIERVDRGSAEEFDRVMERRGLVRHGGRWMTVAEESRPAASVRAPAGPRRTSPVHSPATVSVETPVAAGGPSSATVEPPAFRTLGGEFALRATLSPLEDGEAVVVRGAADLPDGTVVTTWLISGSGILATRDAAFSSGTFDCELAPLPGRLFPALYTVRVEIEAALQPASVRAALGGGNEHAAKEIELAVRLDEREFLLGLAYEEIESAAGALLALGLEGRRLREAARKEGEGAAGTYRATGDGGRGTEPPNPE